MSSEHKNDQEQEFNLLLNKFKEKLNKAKFDLENGGEYIIKEHCVEIRRQVQLAKEETLLKIEEITDALFKKIDLFESDSLEAVSTANNDVITSKLNELKSENDKWNKCLDEHKIDSKLIDNLRDCISKFTIERENINQLLFNSQLLEFEPIKMEQVSFGTLSNVVIDSFEHKIDISHHIKSIKGQLYDDLVNSDLNIQYCGFFSNGDFVLCGTINKTNNHYNYYDRDYNYELSGNSFTVILSFDLEKNELKIMKKNSLFKVEQLVSCSNKICALFESQAEIDAYRGEYIKDEMGIKLPGEKIDYNSKKYVVLDQNLEILHRSWQHNAVKNGKLEAASDSYLIFTKDPNFKNKYEDCLFFLYNWSLQFVRAIGKSTDAIEIYHSFSTKIDYFLNEIYITEKIKNGYCLKVFDDYTGNIIKTLNLDNHLSLDCNNNMASFSFEENKISLFNFNGNLLLKSQNLETKYEQVKQIRDKNGNIIFLVFYDAYYCIYYKKNLDESNYIVKSEF
jgi:hypothetical protein